MYVQFAPSHSLSTANPISWALPEAPLNLLQAPLPAAAAQVAGRAASSVRPHLDHRQLIPTLATRHAGVDGTRGEGRTTASEAVASASSGR